MLTSMQPCSRARLCCCASTGARPSENASRRRSQRLRQPRDNSRGDLRQELHEREARAAELQRAQQEVQHREADEEARHVAQRLQEQATRLLLEAEEHALVNYTEEEEAGRSGSAADAVASSPVAAGAAGALPPAAAPPDEAVEPDFILEQQGATALGGQRSQDGVQLEISRQSEALLEIIQAGERVEEAIAEHRAEVDTRMLTLLARRIKTAQQMEKQAEVVQGLQLLYRRLKAEVDRQRAPPALQLLDELMGILDPGAEAVTVAQTATREERRREAAARVRAAFSGGLPGGADVLSLAQQLSGGGGLQLADELVADPVDPMDFMAQVTELLGRVQQQQVQLAAFLEQQQAQQARQAQQREEVGEVEGAEEESDRSAATAMLEAESLLEQRQAAEALVQESLSIAETVSRQMRLGM